MKRTILMFAAVGAMLFTGCKDNASDKVKAENVEAAGERDSKEVVYPEITFEESEFDFGNIVKGTNVEHVFKFTNTGQAPLVITNASSSCGCTVPTYPKNQTIAPGDSGEMLVKFNGAGNGQVTKTVTVSANTEAGKEQIKIKAFVEADETETAS